MIRSTLLLTLLLSASRFASAHSTLAQIHPGYPYEPKTLSLLLEARITLPNFLASTPDNIPLAPAVIPALQSGATEVRVRLSAYSATNQTVLVSYFLVSPGNPLPGNSDPEPSDVNTIAQFQVRLDSVQFVTATRIAMVGRTIDVRGGSVLQLGSAPFSNGVVISFSVMPNCTDSFQDVMLTFPGLLSTWAPAAAGLWSMAAPEIDGFPAVSRPPVACVPVRFPTR